MSYARHGRQVGILVERKPAGPMVILFINHVMLTTQCANDQHAARVIAEIRDVFDLWGEADERSWKPEPDLEFPSTETENADDCKSSASFVREGGLEPPHG